MNNSTQIADLNSARGIAAVIVLFHHISLVHQTEHNTRIAFDTVMNAHGAVIFFFVLSGFVLASSLMRSGVGTLPVMQFLTRRAFRIYPALIAAFVLAALVWSIGQPSGNVGQSDWYDLYSQRFYNVELGWFEMVKNILPVSFAINPPTWSIFVEILGSALIPLIFIWFRKGPVFIGAGLLFFLCLSAIFVGKADGFHYYNFVIFFAFGAAICFHNPLASLSRPALQGVAVFAGASLLLCRMAYKWLVFGELSSIEEYNSDWNMSLLEGVFSMILIATMAAPQWRNQTVRLPKFLGDYSYSIYLLHFPLIVLAMWIPARSVLLDSQMAGMVLLWGGVPALTLCLSALSFHYIEKPSIKLGHVVSKMIETKSETRPKNAPATISGPTAPEPYLSRN